MDPHIIVFIGFGGLVLLTAWVPLLAKDLPLSLPIICVGLGALIFTVPGLADLAPRPQDYLPITERLTEVVLVVALMGAGLKLDRALDWPKAMLTWRLLAMAMPLTIGLISIVAHFLLGLQVAAALLLASALAPTDPVLASDVQVGPPGEGEEDEIRFTLTSEAGLNDGLAFPFVNLAIALAATGITGTSWLRDWLLVDVVWKLSCGILMGLVVGRALGWLTFRLPRRARLSRTGDGFVALGITGLSYGFTELVHGYGFVAVFVSAVAFRSIESRHEFHHQLHDFIEQLERLLMMILLVAFGGALVAGDLLVNVTWEVALFTGLVILVVRPLAAGLSLFGRNLHREELAIIAFFGIRGIGSIYYLAYALSRGVFDNSDLLWTAVSLVVLCSILLHGATVTPVMNHIDQLRKRLVASN